MIEYYIIKDGIIECVQNPKDISDLTWVDVCNPSSEEIKLVSTMFSINTHDIEDVLDPTERPRFNYDMVRKNQFLLLRSLKSDKLDLDKLENPMFPIGIFFTSQEKIVTVNQIESKEFQNLIKIINLKKTKKSIHLFLELIQAIFNRLDRMSHQISIKINEIQKQIISSRNIQKVHDPFKINSFMIFFNTAMQGNYNALEAYINKNFKLFEDDPKLYEKVDDLMIDIEQVYKFSTIYRDQVNNLVDQTNNIINNNLNNVFKVVGSISLLISIPTLIASFYGMNVNLPGGTTAGQLGSFYVILGVSFSISVAIWLIFRKLRWL